MYLWVHSKRDKYPVTQTTKPYRTVKTYKTIASVIILTIPTIWFHSVRIWLLISFADRTYLLQPSGHIGTLLILNNLLKINKKLNAIVILLQKNINDGYELMILISKRYFIILFVS